MNKKRVLILGGAGYIGTYLSHHLVGLGYNVTVMDICWFGEHLEPGIRLLKKDIFDITREELEGYDTVIFLAGLSNDPMAEYSPKDNFVYNTGLPAYVGYLARETGVKQFLFASSCSVYGYTHNSTFTEEDSVSSNYPYGVSKLQGERALLALADEEFSVICFRQGTVSGYTPRMRLDLAINTMFKNAIQSSKITLSNAKIWRPILGLSDLAQAYHLALQSDLKGGHLFNICSFNTTIGELAKQISSYVLSQYGINVSIEDAHVQDYRNYKVSIEKVRNQLGYNPQQNDLSILNDLSTHLHLFRDFDDENYYNIRVFRKINEPQIV